MNVLPYEKKRAIIHLLVEGNSIRSIERLTSVHRDTIMRLLVKVGTQCRTLLDDRMRRLKLTHLQCDEIWTFVLCKQGNIPAGIPYDPRVGDQYLYIAFDEKTKLIPTFTLGKRTAESTNAFMFDLSERIVTEHPQISTDGFNAYPAAINAAFGNEANYGQIIKDFAEPIQPGRYGPPIMVASERRQILGLDDLPLQSICTSHVERNNLNIRTFMKRFTRLSLGFSKKLENLAAAVALHVAYHNLCRVHRTLRVTPAMAAAVTDHVWELDELLNEVEMAT